jgi:hypothetical protein
MERLRPELSKMLDAMWKLDKEFFPEKIESVIRSAKDYFSPRNADKTVETDNKTPHQEYPNDFFEKKFRADYAKYKKTIPLANIELFRDMEIERLSEIISAAGIVPRHQRIKAEKGFEAFTTAESYIYYLKNLDTNKVLNGNEKSKKSPYSAMEWATIFYYADAKNLVSDGKTLKSRLEAFRAKHNLSTTYKSLVSQYHRTRRRIVETSDYPIEKLNFIIPFLNANYPTVVTQVEEDIKFLQDEISEKERDRY